MKLEKKIVSTPTIKWGLLGASSVISSSIRSTPKFLINDLINKTTYFATSSFKVFQKNSIISHSPINSFYSDPSISIFDKYHFLRLSSFINFFERQHVDIPRCFKKTQSLRRSSFELPFLKLTNYIMRQGKKEQTFALLSRVFSSFLGTYKESPSYSKNILFAQWAVLFFIFNNTTFFKHKIIHLNYSKYLPTLNNHFFKNGTKYHFFRSNLHALIARYIFHIQPLFQFSLFNLGKKARKSHSKKKSKYIFIWKYTPVYKRKNVLLKLLASDVKFNTGRTLYDRLELSFSTLYYTPQKSHVFYINNFAHNYVFKNFRRSLLANFKTTA